MSTHPSPTFAKTIDGSRLPLVALPQTELLTVNANSISPLSESVVPGADITVLRLDMESGTWVLLATVRPGVLLPIHYHTGPAEVFTLQGRWNYVEYPGNPQTAGSYLYEPGGSVHTFQTPPDNTEDTVIFVRVVGANINFTDDGRFHSIVDAVSIRHVLDKSAADGVTGLKYISGAATVIAGSN